MHFCYCNGVENSAIKTLSEHTSTNEHKLWKLPTNDERNTFMNSLLVVWNDNTMVIKGRLIVTENQACKR